MNKKHIDDVQTPTVEEHFKLLLKDNSIIDSEMNYVTSDNLPYWYDEKLYKKAQNLYKGNMLPVIIASLVGLISVLSITTILKILNHTKQSNTPCAAFKRYIQTVVHMHIMFTSDPNNSDSKWYKTVNVIKWKHHISNKRSQIDNIGEISQKDMVFTQFAFVGYLLLADKSIGLRNKPEEEEIFNHFWRVNGYMLGIPDRLNVCRKTAKETRKLCQMIRNIYVKCLNESSSEFYHAASAVLDGLWYSDITLDKDAMLAFTYRLHGIEYKRPLGWYSWLNMKYHDLILYLYLVPYIGIILRIYYNYLFIFTIWFAQKWPIFAWAKFGRKNSQINLYPVHR